MPRFRCTNTECREYNKEELIPHVMFKWNEKTQKFTSKEDQCPVCNSIRETVKEEGDIKIPYFKAENAKNYNNKSIRKYDYDHEAANATRDQSFIKNK